MLYYLNGILRAGGRNDLYKDFLMIEGKACQKVKWEKSTQQNFIHNMPSPK